jgi:Domain of unknown function (DUF222)
MRSSSDGAEMGADFAALAEAHLAELATQHRPDHLAKLADRLGYCLNPDGNFTDIDRARRRGLTLGNQDIDGMSRLNGWLTNVNRSGVVNASYVWATIRDATSWMAAEGGRRGPFP